MVDDAFALADAKLVPSSLPLRIVSAVASRANYPVWVTAIGHLRAWSRLLATAPPPNAIHALVARVMPQVVHVSCAAFVFLRGCDLTAFAAYLATSFIRRSRAVLLPRSSLH